MEQLHPQALAAAVESSDHPEWGDHYHVWRREVDVGFVLGTWLEAVLATAVGSGLVIGLIAVTSSQQIVNPEPGFAYGVGTVVTAFVTFIAFVAVLVHRLRHTDHDRLMNSLAVGAAHTLTAVVIAAVAILTRYVVDPGPSGLVDAGWADWLATAATLLVEGAPAAIFAGLLAPGLIPARGGIPRGQQGAELDQDRQL
ncbi:MAG: hypothetical protein KDC46_10020 [Thermoleophilia bacterium]|nr:hypothetical protein [Thermoleophilia bacterium]